MVTAEQRPPIHVRCPPPLRRLLAACLEQDPRRRPSAGQVLAEIHHLRETWRDSQSGVPPSSSSASLPSAYYAASLAVSGSRDGGGTEVGTAVASEGFFSPEECLNLRLRSALPSGRTLYIQSGDPGDFDGELSHLSIHLVSQPANLQLRLAFISPLTLAKSPSTFTVRALPALIGYLVAVAGQRMKQETPEMEFALVVSLS